MKTLFVVRHGRISDVLSKIGRWIDCPLSVDGLRDSLDIVELLQHEKVSTVITTGRQRTDAIGFALVGPRVTHSIDRRLQERKYKLEKNWSDVLKEFPGAEDLGKDTEASSYPHGETEDQVRDRVLAAWDDLRVSPAERVAIIGHGSSNRWLLARLMQHSRPTEQDNGTVFQFDFHGDTPMLIERNTPIRQLLLKRDTNKKGNL